MGEGDLETKIARLQRALGQSPMAGVKSGDPKRTEISKLESEDGSEPSTYRGYFELATGVAVVGFALTHIQFWWLLFVGFGIGSDGAKQLARASKSKPVAALPEASLPELHEVDVLCDGLLRDLQASPEVVKAFLRQPERAVEQLRSAAKAVDARRQQLAAQRSKEQVALLEKKRIDLTTRRDALTDSAARAQFESALVSLSSQAQALQHLVTTAERLEAEYVSLLALLEELKTRVMVAAVSSSAPQLQAVQASVERLGLELEAIAESVQSVDSVSKMSRVEDVLGPSESVRSTDPLRQKS
jgi:hypothetical protein